MKEKSKNTLWGYLVLLFVAASLFCFAYGVVSLCQDLVHIG